MFFALDHAILIYINSDSEAQRNYGIAMATKLCSLKIIIEAGWGLGFQNAGHWSRVKPRLRLTEVEEKETKQRCVCVRERQAETTAGRSCKCKIVSMFCLWKIYVYFIYFQIVLLTFLVLKWPFFSKIIIVGSSWFTFNVSLQHLLLNLS